MSFANLEELPTEVSEQLPEGAQQIFMAAFNTASADGLSEEEATQAAWESVKNNYEQGENGEWQLKDLSDSSTGNMYGG
jgi:cation transport regulator